MDDERLERVTNRLNSSPKLAEAVRRAIIERKLPLPADVDVAPTTSEAVERDVQPLESLIPLDFLEAIVQRVGRPPLLIRNDAVELELLEDFPAGTDAHIKNVEPFIKSVGRVE